MLDSLLETIGNTPLIALKRFAPEAQLYGKVESQNPLFSVKCRTAWGMIRYAERQGLLKPGDRIIEPTSGNTGIGLAWVCSIKGYKLTVAMPETMSIERRAIMKFLGAEIVLTPGADGMKGAVSKAQEIAQEEKIYFPNQFANPGNVEIHYETTGPELWEQSGSQIDIAVFGVGTGGTLSGAGRYLREKNKDVQIIAVEPSASPVLSGGQPGKHKIQGIGAGFVPQILDRSLITRVVTVSNEEAISTSQELGHTEGLLCGISCGAAAFVARNIARENPSARTTVILPDTGERYLSTDLFQAGDPPSK